MKMLNGLFGYVVLYSGGGAKAPEPPDTEEDDYTVPDQDDELDLEHLFDEEFEDEEEEDEQEEEESEEEEELEDDATPDKPSKKEGKVFTEEDVNRIVQERLHRQDKKFREEYTTLNSKLTNLEKLTGMDIGKIETHIKQAQVKSRAQDWGITEDEANKILENEYKAGVMEQKFEEMRRENENTQRIVNYDRQKAQFLSKPLVKQFEKEIDAFAQQGAALDFEPAMKYVLGQAVLEGKIDMDKAIEQKTISSMRKKSKSPERGGYGGGSDSTADALTREEKHLALNLGITTKEYLAQKKRVEQQKKNRSK